MRLSASSPTSLRSRFNNRGVAHARSTRATWRARSQDYDQAIRLKPDYADAFNNRGIARQAKGDLDGALADYDEAIRLQPDYADAFNNRGIARYDQGDLDGALADYNEAIRLKPDFALALSNRDVCSKPSPTAQDPECRRLEISKPSTQPKAECWVSSHWNLPAP